MSYSENKLDEEHYVRTVDTTALDYEVPEQSLQQNTGIYEMEPYSKTAEIYEPVADGNVYSTPCVLTKVRAHSWFLVKSIKHYFTLFDKGSIF